MTRPLALVLAVLAAGGGAAAAIDAGGFLLLPRAASAGDQTLYGHIDTLAPRGGRFLLRFDPAWFTSGVTANTAAAEDGVVPRGQPVPNDNYVVEESHRRYSYLVPASARVTVLTNRSPGGITATPISVSQLAQIVRGRPPRGLKLFEPLDSGVWIRVHVDTVRSIDQQYRP